MRIARYSAYCAGVLMLIAVAAALILPAFVDTPRIRTEIQRKLSEAVHGEVAWKEFAVRILPRPGGVLRQAKIAVPGTLDVDAEELAVRLSLWPLLRGRVEIVSLSLSGPVIRLDVAPLPETSRPDDAEPDFATAYRSTAGGVADIVRRFAPDTVLSIDNAEVEFSAPGILPVALHEVMVRARTGRSGMNFDASVRGTHWARIRLSARVQYADLASEADIEMTGLKPQPWLDHYLEKLPLRVGIPDADVRLRARVDSKTTLNGSFEARANFVEVGRGARRARMPDVKISGKITAGPDEVLVGLDSARLGMGSMTGGKLRYFPRSGHAAVDAGFDLDTARTMENVRKLGTEAVSRALNRLEVQGRAEGHVKVDFGRSDWKVEVGIEKSDTTVQIRDLPGPVRIAHGVVEIDRHGVHVSRAAAAMPAGHVRAATVRYSYKDRATAVNAEFDIDLAQGMELARRAVAEQARDELAVVQSVSGRAQGTAKLSLDKDWSVALEIPKADAQVQVRGLPGPARFSSGSVRVTPGAVKVDRAAVSLLDARATGSATIRFDEELRVQGSIAEGTVGEKFIDWVWRISEAPPRTALKAPISITAPRFAWGPKGVLDLQATGRFVGGPAVGVDLSWVAGALQVRRATIKDQRSNATMAVRSAGSRLDGWFSGSLHGASIAAMLAQSLPREGGVSGELRFAFDRDRPRDATADGKLTGESLDISWLVGQPVSIERVDLAADGASLQVREAVINWAEQRATIRGAVKQGAGGPVIDAQLDSRGIDLEPLLGAAGRSADPAVEGQEPSGLWPLPVTGTLTVRSDFVKRARYTVAPFAGTLVLEQRRAKIELQQARLCGISLPLAIELTPGGFVATARVSAQKQQLEQTAHCLTDQRVLITGEFDLTADITSRGQPGDFARNLEGTVTADVRDGRVMKFALLGNILSMQGIASLMKEGTPKLDAQGFPYRSIRIGGRFEKGRFLLDEGAFRSDAVGLAANGWISLLDHQTRLTVLVAPFSRLDELARSVPVLGYIVGGAFTSVPVGVSGDILDPLVVPLGPRAITSELTGIFERTLKLPVKLVEPRAKEAP